MKKKMILITGSALALILVVGLVLGLITVKPFARFGTDYEYIQIYDFGSNQQQPATASSRKKLDDGLKTSNFSVLRATLELQGGYGLRFYKVKNAETKKKEVLTRTAAEVRDMKSSADQYMLRLQYKDVKTLTVSGEKLSYDNVLMFIPQGRGEMVSVRVFLYESSRLENQSDEENISSELYTVKEMRMKMRTTRLYNAIGEVIESYKGL